MLASSTSEIPRARRLIAVLMVVEGTWFAFGTLVSSVDQYPVPAPLWLAAGFAALGTAWSGVRLLQQHPEAAKPALFLMSVWLATTVAQAAILGLSAFVNPFTVAQLVILPVAVAFTARQLWR